MTRQEFLDTLRRRLSGLPEAEIDELIADYAAHFADGKAAGRSEADIAAALGDPMRLARELRAEAGFRRWESARTPANFFAVLFGFLALVAVDFVFLLPLLGGLVLFTLIAGIVLLALCIAGLALTLKMFSWDHAFTLHYLTRIFGGIGLLGIGVGGGALLLMMVDYVVRLLGKFARLHYELLNKAETEVHMVRTLGWIAAGGLGVGVVFSLAWATGDSDLRRGVDLGFDMPFGRSCEKNGATASERRLKWDGDDTVNIAGFATVHYRGGEGDEVIVRGAPDLVANVEVQGGRITLNCRGAGSHAVDITLPGRVFRKMHLSGSGKVLLENVSQSDLALAISGSGSLRAQGSVDRLTVSISGSGNAKLADLAVKQFTVKVSGSGNIEAAPKDVADITVSGAGDVRLLTRPGQLRSHVAGSGRITQPPLESADGKK